MEEFLENQEMTGEEERNLIQWLEAHGANANTVLNCLKYVRCDIPDDGTSQHFTTRDITA